MADGDEPRRSRGRDRGRDRGDRGPREDGCNTQPGSDSAMPEASPQFTAPLEPVERQRYATGFASQDAAPLNPGRDAQPERIQVQPTVHQEAAVRQEAAPRQQPGPGAEVSRSEPPATRGLPQVERFELPVGDLAQVAQGSGLQWVNSDAQKIAAVQAAIAAEPKPIHMPRERAATVAVQEGPLVLVETKRDLREMKLPYEQGGGVAPSQ